MHGSAIILCKGGGVSNQGKVIKVVIKRDHIKWP